MLVPVPVTPPETNGNGINGHSNGLINGQGHHGMKDQIAICGIGMRLPGGIQSPDAFWDLLEHGRDARGPVPSTRYNMEGFNDSLEGKETIKTRYGYFIEDDLTTLDASFFSLTKNELEKCDPQQRKLLEVTRECLEDAGEVNYRGELIGCYVGTFGEDWLQMSAKESQHSGGYIMTGHGDLMIANRVSYEYDFRGPSLVIKTGCSASLVALHEACRALQSGDATGAIVAGTNLIMGPTTTAAMTAEGILSPDGSCKTFDANADGFARAEAITAVYIKPLEAAIRDGNVIRAVIRATGINSDGKSQSLMSPNGKAHESLMRKVYQDAGLDPLETAFVECHGTGTPTGDPIETTAVGNVFGDKGVYIGSVKPNVGHSEGSSGISSLIKAVLALEHNTIPPNIKFSTPNPKIPFAEKQLKIPLVPTPFPEDRAHRISINSFGIGGANAHVILDSFPQDPVHLDTQGKTIKPELLLLSANTQSSLAQKIDQFQKFARENPHSAADLAYTLALHRENLPHRAFAVLDNGTFTETSGSVKAANHAREVTMIFSGQGAQWAQMGKELIETDADFRFDISEMDEFLQSFKYAPEWTILGELKKPKESSQINCAELSQPLCTAVQIALVNRFLAAGIKPSAVIGHSSGEIAAAYASGIIPMETAMIVAYYRGYVTTKMAPLDGGMAAVGLGAAEVSRYLIDGVTVACQNSPSSTTISGDGDKVEEVLSAVQKSAPDALARRLVVNMAYHSHHMRSLASEYCGLVKAEMARQPDLAAPNQKADFISSVTAERMEDPAFLNPEYWVANLTSPVLFSPAVTSLLKSSKQDGIFLEIGPHSTLAGPLRQITSAASRPCVYAAAMIRSKNCAHSLLSAFGRLFQEGVNINFASSLFSDGGRVLSGLPMYPWDHGSSYWYESRVSHAWRFRKFAHHCLLGSRVPETPEMEPLWRNMLHLEHELWLGDHKIRQDVVFPFAGYIAMAGEAVRQITGTDHGFSIRHVVAQTALVLAESKPIEMLTGLRPRKLTDSDDGEWYDFAIMSYTNDTWIKHCKGQIKQLEEPVPASGPRPDTLSRRVEPARFYDAMANVGIVYGPEFQGLTNITSSTTDGLATAEIVRKSPSSQGSPFFMHPSSIDACLQLLLVAMAKGLGRNFNQLSVPTIIEELEIARGADKMQAIAWRPKDNLQGAGVECVVDGTTVFRMAGLQLTPLDDDRLLEEISNDIHAAARLEWFPDYDFMDVGSLFQPPVSDRTETRLQEEMTLLCILESAGKIAGCQPCQPHFAKFQDWLNREIERAESGTYTLVEDSKCYVTVSAETRREMIMDRFNQLMRMNKRAVAIGLLRICDNAEQIFTGQADTLDILMQDNVLMEIYNVVSFGHSDFVRFLCNTRPTLRILEVGAGTGGTTELILRDLVDEGGLPLYSTYTFTDVSAGFFPQAKDRFAYASNMEYKVFDISQSYAEQGFEPGTYDLIFAANVIHATPVLQDTLKNLQPLLRPDGLLVMTELCAVVRAPNYIFGNFSGWWLGEADKRPYEPYVPVTRWDVELKAAGFAGVDTAVYDEEEPYQYCAAILSKPAPKLAVQAQEPKATILAASPDTGIAQSLVAGMEQSGCTVTTCQLGDALPEDHDIISCLDLELNFFENIPADRFSAFQSLLKSIGSQKILWLTSPVQIQCRDPRSAQTIGVARTIRSELAMPFFTLEIDATESKFADLVFRVFNKICKEENHNDLASDKEFTVHEGTICVGRYHPFSLTNELCEKSNQGVSITKTLTIGKPGLLETLHWLDQELPGSLQQDQVDIKTQAIGLNFRDIVFAMGVIPAGADGSIPLGLEAAGIIQRVGSKVQGLAPGDRVMALAPHGCITANAILPASLVVRIPDHLSFEEAATLPISFTTAMRGLIDIGGLERGQTVLIHSACGGVGIAAIQIAKMIGAEVFATVSTEEKITYLVENYGIPPSHIFNSRDQSFVARLMQETGGRGVDLVLNSLSGELLHASWNCVAEYGMMVELGKRDLVRYGQLDMQPFLANRSYSCIDIAQFIRERPGHMGGMLKRLNVLVQLGLQPIRPITAFSGEESGQAFRYLQKGTHIGKVVLRMPEDVSSIPSAQTPRRITLDPTATYLLAGGLGGLGRSLATWLVESGARNLTFLSRGAGLSKKSNEIFRELEAMGCSVNAVAGAVDNMNDVKKSIYISNGPIKGVLQLAMVLQDAPIVDMEWSAWQAASRPKIDGTWNLHEAFMGQSLDFFWLASSLVTVVDQPGQGNYNAANTFLEAFCQYRHSQGLPASVLNICPIDGVGFVAENPIARRNMKAQGLYFLGEREFLDYVEVSILNSHAELPASSGPSISPPTSWKNPGQLLMGLRSELDLDDPNNRTNWRRDRRMGIYHNVHRQTGGETSEHSNVLKSFLTRATDDPSLLTDTDNVDFLACEIGHKIYDFMLKPDEEVNTSLSLGQMGLDSLMAIELRRWLKQTIGLQLSVLEIMGTGSLIKLAEAVAGFLKVKFES